jgi:predicted nucleic acid-binding protein
MPVLDSSFLVALERGNRKAILLSEKLTSERRALWIPAVAWMEVLSGAPQGREAATGELLSEIGSFVPLTRSMAETGAVLQGSLARAGKRVGWNDLQVMATALELGEPVVTLDRDFSGIAGLKVIRP